MFNFKRIICIWICCVSCMFGTTQLSSLVRAVPYEYFDDHEQSFYDLDTEQIQAKYDTRLLSQQMLQTEQQQQQTQQNSENLKGFHSYESGGRVESRKPNGAPDVTHISTAATKLKNNDAGTLPFTAESYDDDANDGEAHNDWLEETATKAAASTSTITETLDELHLPRAASCFANGHKFTHGQKVPRLDNCEVCLCMDGEIFCWWEKCDKKTTKTSTTYDDYSTPLEESSTTRMQLNPKTTYKTTLKPMRKPKINEDYKYDDDDSAEIREMQQEYESIKEQLRRKEHTTEQHKVLHHNKQMVKKKMYQQQQHQEEKEKHNKKITNEKNTNQNNKKQEEVQHSHKQHKTNEQHHAYNRNNNRNKNHDYSSNGSSNKILNFPENLPSVLYYDYKTEEHHQHQHQHREQHLKHQRQKQQQHEKQLKQQQHKQKQLKEQKHVNRHNEYGQDLNAYSSSTLSAEAKPAGREDTAASARKVGEDTTVYSRGEGSSTTFKYYGNGNENIYGENLQTDSDILPEPPTNKPKFLTSITNAMAAAKTTGIPITQLYRLSTAMMGTTTTTRALTNASPAASITLKKQIFLPWDYNKANRNEINSNNNSKDNKETGNSKNNERSEDTIDTDDQDDDAFHRWLTSTETNNKNNFTLNDAIIGSDGDDNDGLDAAAAVGGSALDVSSDEYNVNEINYENINWEADIGRASLNIETKTKATRTTLPMQAMASLTTTRNAFNTADEEEEREAGAIYYENMKKLKNKLNFSENIGYNNNSTNTTYNSVGNSNKNHQQFINSNPYRSNNNNNNNININAIMNKPTGSSGGVLTSTASNEDNGVASVVNIDIMLTASSAESQNQQPAPQQSNTESHNQQRQLPMQQQDSEHQKQVAETQLKFMQPPVLISNTNAADNNNNPLYSIINGNTRNFNTSDSNKNLTNFVGNGSNIKERTRQLQNVGVNLSGSSNSNNNSNNNNFNNNSSSSQGLSNSSDIFKFSHASAVESPANATSAATATPPSLSTTLTPERQCNVMGTLYKIGDILPQDTGNCLQCICIDGSTSDDTPRVTCSPHNCPPLVLPDLFDATGY